MKALWFNSGLEESAHYLDFADKQHAYSICGEYCISREVIRLHKKFKIKVEIENKCEKCQRKLDGLAAHGGMV